MKMETNVLRGHSVFIHCVFQWMKEADNAQRSAPVFIRSVCQKVNLRRMSALDLLLGGDSRLEEGPLIPALGKRQGSRALAMSQRSRSRTTYG